VHLFNFRYGPESIAGNTLSSKSSALNRVISTVFAKERFTSAIGGE